MEKIVDFEKCSGCHACFNACPKNCISMKPNHEGFLYPEVDSEKCVDCGACKEVCPVLKEYSGNPKGAAYACINKDEGTRKNSSSGGIFSLLAEYVLNMGGVVFGAAFKEDLSVCHIEVSKAEELGKLRGSKYLQSSVGETFLSVKTRLKEGKVVLFCGTPCQISGLFAFLGGTDENLIAVDIICHGVPSPKVWKKYLEFVEEKNKDCINNKELPSFRDKKYGWRRFSLSVSLEKKGRVVTPLDKDLFMRAFLKNYCLRPSCYNCSSRAIERQSDITLADFWGIDRVCPELFDNRGSSLVMVNSQRGNEVFESIKPFMKYKEVDMDAAIKFNPAVHTSAKKPQLRQQFMKFVDLYPFDRAVRECIPKKRFEKIGGLIKRIVRKVIGK
ncbi:MAG: Coenzyme F420 hydrogenase/dehydrogenase, beta subunit C-terminal domain [Clostridia bacterium]|nr:Coenzyme F420 hydrogenase/dehydrogenase, beta subunit C-terminal domain [Clostridia bacterium]